MSAFDALVTGADIAVDVLYAEAFSFLPMREVKNGRPVVDTWRDPIPSLVAVFTDVGAELMVGGMGGPARASSGPTISVLEAYLPQGVRIFDRFRRAKDGKSYQVTCVDPDDFGRVLLDVVIA